MRLERVSADASAPAIGIRSRIRVTAETLVPDESTAAGHRPPDGRAACGRLGTSCQAQAGSRAGDGPARPLGALAVPDLERYEDLRDAAEQGEEPDKQQQEFPACGEPLLRDPEAEQELQDADHKPEPPDAVDAPGHDGGDEVKRVLEDEQQPQHGGNGPEGIERACECPDRLHYEQNAQQDVRPPPG